MPKLALICWSPTALMLSSVVAVEGHPSRKSSVRLVRPGFLGFNWIRNKKRDEFNTAARITARTRNDVMPEHRSDDHKRQLKCHFSVRWDVSSSRYHREKLTDDEHSRVRGMGSSVILLKPGPSIEAWKNLQLRCKKSSIVATHRSEVTVTVQSCSFS
ncbi:hypothetical protein EVAR_38964_1 [Eumeta japonica]|uniref:Secreted protein n=1 Tax=Eumeta variegata TaxID=151549 RepID=A0A4C1W8K6_EUMVA|nr:hypothetical protein EVAR_38964_1 [Eumeta japonica]